MNGLHVKVAQFEDGILCSLIYQKVYHAKVRGWKEEGKSDVDHEESDSIIQHDYSYCAQEKF